MNETCTRKLVTIICEDVATFFAIVKKTNTLIAFCPYCLQTIKKQELGELVTLTREQYNKLKVIS